MSLKTSPKHQNYAIWLSKTAVPFAKLYKPEEVTPVTHCDNIPFHYLRIKKAKTSNILYIVHVSVMPFPPSRTSTGKLTMLKTAIMSIRAVVVMVRVIRGQGLLAIMTDDLSSHIQDVEVLLLQCCRDKHKRAQQCINVVHGSECTQWLRGWDSTVKVAEETPQRGTSTS